MYCAVLCGSCRSKTDDNNVNDDANIGTRSVIVNQNQPVKEWNKETVLYFIENDVPELEKEYVLRYSSLFKEHLMTG